VSLSAQDSGKEKRSRNEEKSLPKKSRRASGISAGNSNLSYRRRSAPKEAAKPSAGFAGGKRDLAHPPNGGRDPLLEGKKDFPRSREKKMAPSAKKSSTIQ